MFYVKIALATLLYAAGGALTGFVIAMLNVGIAESERMPKWVAAPAVVFWPVTGILGALWIMSLLIYPELYDDSL